jgi:membrane protein
MNVFQRPLREANRCLRAADRCQQRWPALAFPIAVWSKFNDDQAGNLAALIAYYAFAALFPLLLVLVTVLDIALKNDPSLRDTLLNSALAQYPVIGPQIKASLGSIPGSGLPLIVGIIFLLFGARGVAGAMQNALCEVWGIPREQRPGFPLSLLWAFALVFAVGIGFIVTTFLSGLAGGAGHLINGAVTHVAAVLISLVLNVGVFWLGFRLAVLWRRPWRDLRIGAAVAAVCWQALQLAGGYVVSHQLHRASELYGTFGIVLGLLAWLFLQAEVTLYAAEVDVVLTRRLWPRSLLSSEPDQPAEQAQPDQPDQLGGADQAGPGDRFSLEGQPGPDGPAAAGGQAPIPPPRGEQSASDQPASNKKAGSAR